MSSWALRGSSVADVRNSFGISRKTFEQIEDFIADNKESQSRAKFGIDALVQAMCFTTKGGAQRRSMGQVAPNKRSRPELAYRIPVQRITGRYFAGWTQRKLGSGHYVLYNDTVEAYLIETGMFMRTRRPILKMSVIGMLQMIQTTKTADRFVDWVIGPRRNSRGQFQSFVKRLGGTETVGGMAGPQGTLP